jgi:hypothetical protein
VEHLGTKRAPEGAPNVKVLLTQMSAYCGRRVTDRAHGVPQLLFSNTKRVSPVADFPSLGKADLACVLRALEL